MEGVIIELILKAILLVYPVWRIFKRAGLNPVLSLTILIPYIGFLVCGIVLGTSTWKFRQAIKGEK